MNGACRFSKVAGEFFFLNISATTLSHFFLNEYQTIWFKQLSVSVVVLFECRAPAFSGFTNPPRGRVHVPKTRLPTTAHLSQHPSLLPRHPSSYLDADGRMDGRTYGRTDGRRAALPTAAAAVWAARDADGGHSLGSASQCTVRLRHCTALHCTAPRGRLAHPHHACHSSRIIGPEWAEIRLDSNIIPTQERRGGKMKHGGKTKGLHHLDISGAGLCVCVCACMCKCVQLFLDAFVTFHS